MIWRPYRDQIEIFGYKIGAVSYISLFYIVCYYLLVNFVFIFVIVIVIVLQSQGTAGDGCLGLVYFLVCPSLVVKRVRLV